MPLTPVDLFRAVGLRLDGPARWGAAVRATHAGVLAIEWPQASDRAPIDISAVGTWIARVPTLTLDGARPAGKALAARLASFWLPGEAIVFIGMAAESVSARIADLARIPLGDDGPSADARWLRALVGFDRSRIWWAETDAAEEYEDALLERFAELCRSAAPANAPARPAGSNVVPFANAARLGPAVHGIEADVAEPPTASPAPGPAAGPERGVGRRPPASLTDAEIDRVNDALQRLACGEPSMQITPSQANAERSVRLMLHEDPARPPVALGQLLRAGRIEGAHRDLDGRWSIRCTRRG